jgi:hypothetical protein
MDLNEVPPPRRVLSWSDFGNALAELRAAAASGHGGTRYFTRFRDQVLAVVKGLGFEVDAELLDRIMREFS